MLCGLQTTGLRAASGGARNPPIPDGGGRGAQVRQLFGMGKVHAALQAVFNQLKGGLALFYKTCDDVHRNRGFAHALTTDDVNEGGFLMQDIELLSYMDKAKLPYSLLFDPVNRRAAAYTNNHRLIATDASPELIAFALANEVHRFPWDESKYDPVWRPAPEWATPEVRQRCVVVWIKRGLETDAYFDSIPRK